MSGGLILEEQECGQASSAVVETMMESHSSEPVVRKESSVAPRLDALGRQQDLWASDLAEGQKRIEEVIRNVLEQQRKMHLRQEELLHQQRRFQKSFALSAANAAEAHSRSPSPSPPPPPAPPLARPAPGARVTVPLGEDLAAPPADPPNEAALGAASTANAATAVSMSGTPGASGGGLGLRSGQVTEGEIPSEDEKAIEGEMASEDEYSFPKAKAPVAPLHALRAASARSASFAAPTPTPALSENLAAPSEFLAPKTSVKSSRSFACEKKVKIVDEREIEEDDFMPDANATGSHHVLQSLKSFGGNIAALIPDDVQKDILHLWTANVGLQSEAQRRQEEPDSWRSSRAAAIVNSWWYDTVVIITIACNASFIGVQVQSAALSSAFSTYEEPIEFRIFEHIFFWLFTSELAIRLAAQGRRFFSGKDSMWNFSDFIIVITMAIEVLFSSGAQFSAMRILRAVRVVRAFRMLHLAKSLQNLRILLQTVVIAIKSMLWTSVIVILLLYVFGVILTQGVVDFCTSNGDCLDEAGRDLLDKFGTIERSLLSLFAAMTNGVSWLTYLDSLRVMPVFYHGLFIMYIAMACFAILNVVTGIFVETTMRVANVDRDTLILEEVKSKEVYMKQAAQVFREMDINRNDELTIDEFKEGMQDRRVIAYINALKLDFSDIMTLFVLLDRDQNGSINLDEFLRGCMHLKGEAKAFDVVKLQYQSEWLMHMMTIMRKEVTHMIDSFDEATETLRGADLASPSSRVSIVSAEEEEDEPARRNSVGSMSATNSSPRARGFSSSDGPKSKITTHYFANRSTDNLAARRGSRISTLGRDGIPPRSPQ